MTSGRVVQLVTRQASSTVVAPALIGANQVTLDNVRSFNTNAGGFVFLNELLYAYNAVDSTSNTITLTSTLTADLALGHDADIFPYSVTKWALVRPDGSDGPSDAVWVLVPHALSGWLAADGLRAAADEEQVTYQTDGTGLTLTDVRNKENWLDPAAIPAGAITETNIQPGSITTPLLAANAVAAQNIQAGAVQADNIAADAIDGKTITGALIRTAASGARLEINSVGLSQYAVDGVTKLVDMNGTLNVWRGSGEFDDLIVRDGMEIYGRNNIFAMGSKTTLNSSVDGSAQAPGITQDWEAKTGWGRLYLLCMGMHVDSAESVKSKGGFFFGQSWMYKGANWYEFPTVDLGGGNIQAGYKIDYGYTRVHTSSGDYAVTVGSNYNNPSGPGYPTMCRVWNDSAMTNTGSVAPTMLAEFPANAGAGYDYNKDYKVGRCFSSATVGGSTTAYKHIFSIGKLDRTAGGLYWTLTMSSYAVSAAGAISLNNTVNTGVGGFSAVSTDERLVGIARGSSAVMGFPGSDIDVYVINTNYRNMVFSASTGLWLSSDYEWPKVDAVQNGVFTGGDLSTGTFTNFYSLNDVSGTPGGQTALKYTNSHWTGSETWWATFTWRGNSSTSPFPPETRESLSNSIIAKRRTRTTITVPSLPAPIAGTGGARDPAKDVYGWRYYIGKGASDPTRTGRWRQTVQPSGEPTVVTTIALDTYPVFSGNNPPATNTMPGGGPSEFASTSGGFSVMGDGSGGWPLMVEAPPIGAINMYGGPSTSDPNSQWMVCDGRAISRTTYATLFARYSTFYGVGNGSTTFNIPNFSGKMPLGANGDGGSHPRGQTGGAETHTLSTTEMPSHSHGGVTGDDSPDHAHVQQLGGGISNVNNAAGGYVIGNANNSTTSGATARHQHGIGAQGGGGAHNNMPPFLGVNFIIRVL